MSGATLIVADAVLTVDDSRRVVQPGGVLVEDGAIAAVGDPDSLNSSGVEVIEAPGCVVMPGWINTHAHLAMNVFRGLTDDVTLEEFLERLMAAEFQALSPQMVESGVRAALAESIRGGVTSVLDMYFYPQVARDVAAAAGFRLFNGTTFVGDRDPDGTPFDELLARAEEECAQVAAAGGTPWLMPHSAYTLSTDQLVQIADVAARTGARIHTHCAESPGEMALCEAQHGKRPLAVLDDAGLVGPGTVLAHMAQTSAAEIPLLAERGTAVAHCPASNLKLACGIAPIAEMLAGGVLVGLGTDGAASAGSLDLQQSARLAALLAKGVTRDPLQIPAMEAIALGTRHSAQALGRDDLGVLRPGARADLQIIDVGGWSTSPRHDPAAQIIYSATANDVRHVMIDGRFVLRDGVLLTIDAEQARADLEMAAADAREAVSRLV
ncbi:amidohydrolase family protein [Epidermidibacterium keratini]|uniref:Amidohydrolase family protein n=1 Tax=Epidermidibacterium keratini TaxID=1891644 RepID=A0A7L4YRV2_9ACTN|nr:amidohydrolase [Epidermidibacterium keratini]QHC01792.1 amidohydrolase family protein [Epidermidibacterium keratini]